MNQYPQSPDLAGQQPPVYHQDPSQQQHHQPQFQQNQMYAQPQQPAPAAFSGSPSPMPQPHGQPGMPPQQHGGAQYQNATPIGALNRGPAPADCPACGQRAMTNVAYETGNTTQ